jgi:hypothetical protein
MHSAGRTQHEAPTTVRSIPHERPTPPTLPREGMSAVASSRTRAPRVDRVRGRRAAPRAWVRRLLPNPPPAPHAPRRDERGNPARAPGYAGAMDPVPEDGERRGGGTPPRRVRSRRRPGPRPAPGGRLAPLRPRARPRPPGPPGRYLAADGQVAPQGRVISTSRPTTCLVWPARTWTRTPIRSPSRSARRAPQPAQRIGWGASFRACAVHKLDRQTRADRVAYRGSLAGSCGCCCRPCTPSSAC